MRVTQRFWSVAGIGGVLAVWGFVSQSPILLLGTGAVGGWLVMAQFLFLETIGRTLPNVHVTVETEQDRVMTEETTDVTLNAAVDGEVPGSVQVTAETPVGVEGTFGRLRLESPGQAVDRVRVSWPVAGQFGFDQPTVTFLDRFGLFEQSLRHGDTTTVVVEPRLPQNLHVGQGGEGTTAGFGTHETGQTGSGLKPAEIREYLPGDALREMDWKATARLDEPHVREFEIETDRETKLVVDGRASMGHGPSGREKIEFTRQVALAVVDSARRATDPLGCYIVGDEGLTDEYEPGTSPDHGETIRQRLLALSPMADSTQPTGVRSPLATRRRVRTLATDDSAFATKLRPFLDEGSAFTQRVASYPLVTAVKLYQSRHNRAGWMILLTDDERPQEVREAVRVARQIGDRVSVYLTPTVLFDESSLTDLDDAYDRYVAFESFRQELDAISGVAAFEVGPQDRLASILETGERSPQEVQL